MKKVILVGGVAGGATAASQLRRLNPDIEIVIYERYEDISYGSCGMPYYIGGEVEERDSLVNMTPGKFRDKNIFVKTGHEVTSVNTDENTVTVLDKANNREITDSYDYLVLSPGGSPKKLPSVKDGEQVFSLHRLADLDYIMSYIEDNNVKEAVLIGSGYIGLEVTENLTAKGIHVTILQHDERIYKNIEADMNGVLYEAMTEHGITLKLNTEIDYVDGSQAVLSNGEKIDAELIITGVGISPNTGFLNNSGVSLKNGLIPINKNGQTNVKNIYALGDAAVTHYQHIPEITMQAALAWPAHRLAHIIANQISGDSSVTHEGFLGTNIVKFFDYHIATFGLSEKEVADVPHFVIDQKQKNKSGYMKGAAPIHVRVYVSTETGIILRAAVVGTEGVDKRIDILSAHTRLGGTVYDLINIEIGYSPPFSSPKDIINMVGYKAREKAENL
ncbi:coenzyme A disulfide reductase [Jeotgalicoccus coquinae]|uniref:CoA-disulfide reductase n=1 Tax=Jeotgalicoccus coquinae TaxID=709509 RepID=A0A6V7RKN1_9STAP|nr:CoA-disulfide reductase [Jeotgalicoccus coquinae]MBB6422387.1 CoA-disulfide reductase [Jeotgalicoccus coquinae]GGE16206.1 coenzyme A disulfide reductase [Jeotgalicoccus coquinae]CAD2078741.1 Coenzyme A disulfide reductase [Jeotgalicoccus coquinae]